MATPYSGIDEPATPYLRRRCPWWPLRPAAPEPGSEDAPAARGRPVGPRVGKSEARPGTARLRSMRKGSAGAPLPREARDPAPPPAAANRAPRCRDPPRPPPALLRPPLGAAPDPARRGAPGGKLGAAGETRSDAAAAAAVPRLDRRPRQVPHPLQARRSSPDPRRDLPPPFAPPAATSASSEISPAASCPPPPLCSGPPGDPGVPGTGGGGWGHGAQSRRVRAEGRARRRTGGQRCPRFAGRSPVARDRGRYQREGVPALSGPPCRLQRTRPEGWLGCGAGAQGSALLGRAAAAEAAGGAQG